MRNSSRCDGVAKAGRRGDDAVASVPAAFLVAAAVQRKHDFRAEPAAFAEHLVDQLATGVGVRR